VAPAAFPLDAGSDRLRAYGSGTAVNLRLCLSMARATPALPTIFHGGKKNVEGMANPPIRRPPAVSVRGNTSIEANSKRRR
jgi:hypothetical protein